MTRFSLLLILLLLSVRTAEADNLFDTQQDKIRAYGFLTQGWIKSSHNNYFGDSTSQYGSFDFRELGVGLTARPTDKVRFSALALSRNAGGTDKGGVRIDHALIDISLGSSRLGDWGMIVGREKIPLGFYNSSRDVANTRPSILLAQSNYFDNARRFMIHHDGVVVYLDSFYGDHSLKTQLNFSKTPGTNNIETESYFLGRDWPGPIDGHYGPKLKVHYENLATRTKAQVYLAKVPITYSPVAGDTLGAGTIHIDVAWLSFGQEIGNFEFVVETFLPKLEYKGFGKIPDRVTHPRGYYTQVTYRPTYDLELFGRYDVMILNKDDRDGKKYALATRRPAYDAFANNSTLGVRYFLRRNLALSAEYHWIDGTGWLPLQDSPDVASHVQKWGMLMGQISYSFQ